MIGVFIVVPLLAVIAAIPVGVRWGLGWPEVVTGLAFYAVSGLGITVGFHRYFTHGSFKAGPAAADRARGRRVSWPSRGRSSAGSPITAVTTRSATAQATRTPPGGTAPAVRALAKGLCAARTSAGCSTPSRPTQRKFAPDLLADRASAGCHRAFRPLGGHRLLAPAMLGGLLDAGHWHGALTAFFWAGLVRIALLHHVTWSINSVCHVVGRRPFSQPGPVAQRLAAGRPRRSASPGTTCTTPTPPAPGTACCAARSTSAARVIWALERLGWATEVRWPDERRLAAKLTPAARNRRFGTMATRSRAPRRVTAGHERDDGVN